MKMAFFITNKRIVNSIALGGAVFLCLLGLTQTASAASAGDITVTEFMANPAVVSDANGEWIEVKNTSGHGLELINWDIDGSTITGSNGPIVLAANAVAVICKNANRAQNDGVLCDGTSGFSLGNTSDTINVRDADNAVVNSLSYAATNVEEGKSTHANGFVIEAAKKYSVNNFGTPARNVLTPPEPLGGMYIGHSIDTNRNAWPDFHTNETALRGRTIRLYKTAGASWTFHSQVVTTGKHYQASAKFVVEPGSYAMCEVAEPGFEQTYARTIIAWYHAPQTGVDNISGATDEYGKCIAANVSSRIFSSHVFGDAAI